MGIHWLRNLIAFWSGKNSSRCQAPGRRRQPLHLEEQERRLAPTVYTWVLVAAGTFAWNTAANWSPNTGFPSSPSDTAILTPALAGNETINLNQSITVGAITLGAPSGSSTITVAAGTGGSLTIASAGTITKTRANADVISVEKKREIIPKMFLTPHIHMLKWPVP